MQIILEGAGEAQRKILALSAYGRSVVASAILDAAAEVVREKAVENVRRRSGQLADSIEVEGSGPDERKVGPNKDGFYGRYVELGTPERSQKSGRKTGRMPSFPFLRPALDDPAVVETANRTFREEMLKARFL